MTNQQKFSRLRKILDDASVYGRSIGKLNFDMQCCAPEEGMEQAGEDIAVLSKQLFRLTHSKTYARLVTELAAGHEGLSPVQQKVVGHKNDAWQKGKNISAKLDYEMTLAYNRAYAKWLEAKKADDYSIFRDAFADLIGYTRKAIDLRDEKKATYYDACLDDYEKGGSIAQLDAFFGALKERIVPLLARIEKDGKPIRTDFMSHSAAGGVLEVPAGAGGPARLRAGAHDDGASVHDQLRPARRARHHALLRGKFRLQHLHHAP